MYGKYFASTFTGSMVGAGPAVFAVWGYAIANADAKGHVEINPPLLGAVIGMKSEEVRQAIARLEAPDPDSRSKAEDGRRMVREGQFIYRIVNHGDYRGIRDEDARREYQRNWIRDKRSTGVNKGRPASTGVDRRRPASTQVEVEVKAEEEVGDTDLRTRDLDLAGARVTRVANGKPESHTPFTGYHLAQTWGRIRAEFTGGMPWVGVKDANGKASTMADELNENPSAKTDVEPTMRLLLENAKSGRSGDKSALVLSNPSFGFGAWCSQFTELQEALRKPSGVAVVSGPTDRPEPPEWTRTNGPR